MNWNNIKNSPCAGVIVFNLSSNNDKCVIVQAKPKKENSILNFGFPKGKRKKHETMFQCAFRELNEETGIIPSQIVIVNNVYLTELSDRGNIATTYLVGKFIDPEKEHVFTFDHGELTFSGLMEMEKIHKLLKKSRSDILYEAYNIITNKDSDKLITMNII